MVEDPPFPRYRDEYCERYSSQTDEKGCLNCVGDARGGYQRVDSTKCRVLARGVFHVGEISIYLDPERCKDTDEPYGDSDREENPLTETKNVIEENKGHKKCKRAYKRRANA